MCRNAVTAMLFLCVGVVSADGPADGPADEKAASASDDTAKRRVSLPRLEYPVRVVFRGQRRLLVSDYRQKKVLTLRIRDLAVVGAFEIPGRPLAIAWARRRVYVGNETIGRVQVFDKRGQWLYDLGGAEGHVAQPNDIAVDVKDRLVFVVDSGEKLVKVFHIDGPLLYTFPDPSSGQLTSPVGIVADRRRNEVIVSDHGDPSVGIEARIQIFNYAGEFLRGISGKVGGGMLGSKYQFSRPQGLAIDRQGHIFVAASWLGRVLVFDQDTGEQLASLGEYGTDPGQLSLPLDVLVHRRSKDVFVTNNRLGRIEVFQGGGMLP